MYQVEVFNPVTGASKLVGKPVEKLSQLNDQLVRVGVELWKTGLMYRGVKIKGE